MRAQVDLQRAMRDASSAYRQFPFHFAAGIVGWAILVKVLSLGMDRLLPGHSGWMAAIVLVVNLLGYYILEVGVATMFLGWKAGQEPEFGKMRDVLSLRGLFSYCLRRVWCYCAFGLPFLFAYGVVDFAWLNALGLKHVTGQVSGPAEMLSGALLAVFTLCFQLWMTRYALCTSMFAVAGGDRHKLFRFAVERSLSVWPLMAKINLIETLPSAIAFVLTPLVAGYFSVDKSISTGIETGWIVFLNLLYVWFLMLRAGLTMQLVRVQEPAAVEA